MNPWRLGAGAIAALLVVLLVLSLIHFAQLGKYRDAVRQAERLRLGMTMSEVQEILGPPEEVWAEAGSDGRLVVKQQMAHVSLGLVEFVVWFSNGRDSLAGAGWDGVPKL